MTDVLTEVRPLVGIMARERTRSRPDLYDDAVQEGLIAAWQATQSPRRDARTYAAVSARYGILSALRGRPSFGSTGRRGWQDAHDGAGALPEDFDRLTMDPGFEEVETRSALADVRLAVAALDPEARLLVFRRFWLGETLTRHEHNRFRAIASRLRLDLAHLAAA